MFCSRVSFELVLGGLLLPCAACCSRPRSCASCTRRRSARRACARCASRPARARSNPRRGAAGSPGRRGSFVRVFLIRRLVTLISRRSSDSALASTFSLLRSVATSSSIDGPLALKPLGCSTLRLDCAQLRLGRAGDLALAPCPCSDGTLARTSSARRARCTSPPRRAAGVVAWRADSPSAARRWPASSGCLRRLDCCRRGGGHRRPTSATQRLRRESDASPSADYLPHL